MILPFELSKRIVEIGVEVLQVFVECPNIIKTSIAMRVIRAAALSKTLQRLYETNLIQQLYQKNKTVFNLPMLYLAAQSKRPDSTLHPTISMSTRNDVLQYYYSGINQMNLKNFEDANIDFAKALTLAKALEFDEIIRSIIDKLSLSSFLSHTQRDVFLKRIPIYLKLDGPYEKIWDINSEIDRYDSFMNSFSYEISRERTRRLIIDLALTTSRINIDHFVELCGPVDEAKKMTQNEIEIIVNDDMITFNGPFLLEKVQNKIQDLTVILDVLE
ncbi:hypothetical protein GPJ56_010133 [Histomonas meleagridis]|uniref:uncharacterized protein n=1 Tax=Histomonas meleagridis TaxID=135588 RepID=UPI003559ABBD|nr:hypothetical protein GPJ56_010133 [Histomonas meleagridis]KAH0806790.1 hypothetical protein GO595_000433 [Histomonas meleagridis]